MSISYPTSNSVSNTTSGAYAALPRQQFFPSITLPSLVNTYMAFCMAIIGSVSIYDCYLVVYFRESILTGEKNPICLELLRWDPVYFSWFISFKLLGAFLVLAILFGLTKFKFSYGVIVTTAIAMFQIALVFYLQFADSTKGGEISAFLDLFI
ncbi:MAG: hypothetical protein AB8B55_14170 [Mariniblastus sp.]